MSNVEKNSVSCHSIAYMLLLQRNNGTWQGWVGLERTILSPCSFITLKSNPIHQKDIRSFHRRVISTSLNHQFLHLSTAVGLNVCLVIPWQFKSWFRKIDFYKYWDKGKLMYVFTRSCKSKLDNKLSVCLVL
jgi:hypothetical protein